MTIEIDLNRVTRPEFRAYLRGRENGVADLDAYDAEFMCKVIVSWPYDQPVTPDGYLALGLLDAKAVDDAVMASLGEMQKKK